MSKGCLYELIWKRAAASQMADAKLEKTTATISISTSEKFVAQGEVIVFDGFLKVYMESTDNDIRRSLKDMLPPLKNTEQKAFLKWAIKGISFVEMASKEPSMPYLIRYYNCCGAPKYS